MPFLHCRHCGAWRYRQGRGLCSTCWNVPGIRAQYPRIRGDSARYGSGTDVSGGYTLPAEPTAHAPGTLEKLRVLEERAAANIALHHPYDAHYEGDDRPWRWFQRVRAGGAFPQDAPAG